MIKTRYLTNKAEFQKPVKTKDASGESVETWQTIATRMVDIRASDSESTTESGADYEVSNLELRTRYSSVLRDAIKTGYRVIINDKKYTISQLGDVFSRKQLTYSLSNYE
tara:strand:- start:31 stop:360 length:330 start_codon:yes stop_codon:yes gene_type:complete